MPLSVLIAIVCLVAMQLSRLTMFSMGEMESKQVTQLWVGLVIGTLVLVGLLLRNRLAWQWGMVFGTLGAIVSLLVLAGLAALEVQAWVMMWMAVETGMIIGMVVCLALAPSRTYFGVTCPKCGGAGKPKDFVFHRVRCKRCGAEWS